MVMAAVTACQSWQWFLKMRKYVNTLCLVGLEDKQTTSYFLLFCLLLFSRRTNVKGSYTLQSLHHLFVSIWTEQSCHHSQHSNSSQWSDKWSSVYFVISNIQSPPFHQKKRKINLYSTQACSQNKKSASITSLELRAPPHQTYLIQILFLLVVNWVEFRPRAYWNSC